MKRFLFAGILGLTLLAASSCSSGSDGGSVPATPQLWGVSGGFPSVFLRMDPTTGAGLTLSRPGARGFATVNATACDPITGTLYGIDRPSGWLFTMDALAGVTTAIAYTGLLRVDALAFDPIAGILYAADSSIGSRLVAIDVGTGLATAIGAFVGLSVEALACDANTGTLYGATDAANLVTIDALTAGITNVGALGATIRGLAFDAGGPTLYGVDVMQLYAIDVGSGLAAPVGMTGFDFSESLAFDPAGPTLYSTRERNSAYLLSLSPATGAGTLVGHTGFKSFVAAAFDANSGILYAVDADNDGTGPILLAIDASTEDVTVVGPIGFTVGGLAFDPNTNTLFGSDNGLDQMLTIDTTTGNGTVLGPTGFPLVVAIAFDPNSNTLYGVDSISDELITIDTGSGAGTLVGSVGGTFTEINSLTFDSLTNTLFATDGLTRQTATIDTGTGAATALAATAHSRAVTGLAFDPGTGRMYGTTDLAGLIVLDRTTGLQSGVVALAHVLTRAAAIDPASGIHYGIDTDLETNLLSIDPDTGVGSLLGPVGFNLVRCIGFGPGGVLFGVDDSTDQLITIDTATGAGTAVGPTGTNGVFVLTFDPGTGTMYSGTSSALATVDVGTGAISFVGSYGFSSVRGLAFDTVSGTLFGLDVNTRQILNVNPATGAATAVVPSLSASGLDVR